MIEVTVCAVRHGSYWLLALMCALVLMNLAAASAQAATVSIVPNATNAGAWTGSGTGCGSAGTAWQCIDESASTLDDGDNVQPNLFSGGAGYDFTTFTLGEGVVTSVALTGRDTTFGFCSETSSLISGGGATLVSGELGGTSFALTNHTVSSSAATLQALTQGDIDGIRISMGAPSCPWTLSAVWADVTYATFSGTADNIGICNGVTPVIGIAVNGVKDSVVPCDALTGAFRAFPTFTTNDTVTAYYDGVAGGAANAGATWVKAAGSTAGGVVLTRRRYRTEARVAGTPITATDMAKWDGAKDADIYLTATGAISVSDAAALLEVGRNALSPTVNVTTPMLWVHSGATFSPQGAVNVDITAAGTGTCSDAALSRPWCIAGSFTPGTSIVTFRGAGSTAIPGGTYYHLRAMSPDAFARTFVLGAAGATTINASLVTLDGAAGAPVADTTTYSPTLNVSGALTVSGSMTLQGSGAGTMTIGGDVTGSGQINLTGGTVKLANAGAAQLVNASGTLPGTPWRFASLLVSTSSGLRTVTVPATSRELVITSTLTIGQAGDPAVTTLDASALTRPLTVVGNVAVTTRGAVTLAPSTEIDGNLTSSGQISGGSSTLRLAGAGTSTLDTGSGSGAPYDVQVATAGKIVQLASTFAVAHALSMGVGSCVTPVILRSTVAGTQRTITNTGATVAFTGTVVSDIRLANAATVTGASDMGGNANMTFGASSCGTITPLYEGTGSAVGGAVNPLGINGAAAFHMSFRNDTGATANRFRTAVSTSPLDSTVLGLFALDGNGSDRSRLANAMVVGGGAPTYVSGATNFGQAVQLNGTSDYLRAPTNAAYNVTAFTAELWVRSTSPGSSGERTLLSRGDGSLDQFRISYLASTGMLRASLTSNAGTRTLVEAPAQFIFDDAWHHVAMTVDATKTMTLYIDGQPYGSPATYPGTLDVPAEPIRIGGNPTSGQYFAGMIDDVELSNYAKAPDEISGYAITLRPHAQTLWQSANFATSTGTTLSPSCATATRCTDIVYGGPNIHVDGARYYVTQQLLTVNDFWSDPVTTWFGTGDSISVTAPASVTLPLTSPGVDVTTSFVAETACTSAHGCSLMLSAPSDTAALTNTGMLGVVPTLAPGPLPILPALWNALDPQGLGFTVLGNSGTGLKDVLRWGIGTTFANLNLLNFVGARRTSTLLHTSLVPGTEDTTIGVRLNAPNSAGAGTLTGKFTLTAVANP